MAEAQKLKAIFGISDTAKPAKKIGLKSTQIYLSSENLISWTNLGIYKNTFDPEFDPGTQATRRYPITRSYTVGLRILF